MKPPTIAPHEARTLILDAAPLDIECVTAFFTRLVDLMAGEGWKLQSLTTGEMYRAELSAMPDSVPDMLDEYGATIASLAAENVQQRERINKLESDHEARVFWMRQAVQHIRNGTVDEDTILEDYDAVWSEEL